MSMEWWRCKHGAPFDPKWRAIALRAQARPGDVWAVFTTLCDRASQAGDRGSLSGLDLEDVAAGLGYELDEVQRIVTALKDKGLVTDERVTTWEKHQPKREDSSTERVRAHRNAMKRDETQKPAREEKRRVDKRRIRKKEDRGADAPPPTPSQADGLGSDDAAAVANYWNNVAEEHGLSAVRRMTDTRRKKINARLSETGGLRKMAEVIDAIPDQPFLLGRNDRQWKVDFDWLLEPSNFVKVEERKYANGHV